ncbi:unnamed protein product [Anisakis simplex]|uniref:Uncharacterized protein n=1 Tax=Anisakis simplex TaxID=6269 RepID=A0A0M3JRB0_ANISI|nr:unnamed protein product [Anisakis simplex]
MRSPLTDKTMFTRREGHEKNAAEKKVKKDKYSKEQHLKESSNNEQQETSQPTSNVETGKSKACSLPKLNSQDEFDEVNLSSECGHGFESTVHQAQQHQHRPHIMKPKNLRVLTEYDKCKLECKRKRDEADAEEYVRRLKLELEQAEAALSEQKLLQQKEQQQEETLKANTETTVSI